jgi:circadian clock protein KaiB
MRLYVAGSTPATQAAKASVQLLESEYLPPGSTIEVIDLLSHPEAAERDHILAIPTLVRMNPRPVRRIIGNLRDMEKTLKILGFQEQAL